jgi:uncharacterized membrane protein
MINSRTIKGFVTALVLFIIGDIVWHNVVLYDFYATRISAINGGAMGADFPPFLIAFEVIAAAVMTYFVFAAAKDRSVGEGAKHGAMLGLLAGSCINFVNTSLLTGWDSTLALVDTAWAVVLGAIVGSAIVMVAGKK